MTAIPLYAIIITSISACFNTFILPSVDASLILPPLPNRAHSILAYPNRQLSSNDVRGLLTFEECKLSQCEHPRTCQLVFEPDIPCSGTEGDLCHCVPANILQCSSHTHCIEGEVCAKVENFGTACASESFVSQSTTANMLPGENPSPPPFPSEEGLTFDPCEVNSCAFPRFCRTIIDETRECDSAVACHCIPSQFIFCSSSKECVDGEICASVPDRGDLCVSRSLANHSTTITALSPEDYIIEEFVPPTPEDEGEGDSTQEGGQSSFGRICVGIEFLKHLPREALRFEHDSMALVLCDDLGSCATPGHMVIYNKKAQMMDSYCKHARCERKMMKVNSPRYQRGMTIPSRTPGLTFSVFAARYGTYAEEKILTTVLRLGL